MKIVKVETLELEQSGECGILSWRHVFVRIHTDEGISGLGEVGMAYGTGSPAGAPMIRTLAERFVLGTDPFHSETTWENMLRRSFWAEGGGPVVFGAMSALETAMWDIKGRALNMPVHRLLGAKTPEPLRCYASQLQFGWDDVSVKFQTEPSAYRDAAAKARSEGYDCIKVDPIFVSPKGGKAVNLRGLFTPSERKLFRARMEAIREGLGEDADIILELHSFTSTAGALQLAELFEDLDILFVEEPTHYNSPHAHVKVAQHSRIPVATGERLYTRWGFLPYFEAGAIDLAQPDMGLVGGIGEGVRIAHLAHTYDVGIQAHICGSPLATAVGLQVEAAIPNFEIHEHHSYALKPCNRNIFEQDLQPEGGRFEVPTTSGLGMDFTDHAERRMVKTAVGL